MTGEETSEVIDFTVMVLIGIFGMVTLFMVIIFSEHLYKSLVATYGPVIASGVLLALALVVTLGLGVIALIRDSVGNALP